MKLQGILAIVGTALLLTGCDRYLVTVNDRPVSEPPPLLKGFEVSDIALDTCIHQAITDGAIRRVAELETLVCSHGGITSLEGLEFFSRLRTLNLANNDLTTIEPLFFMGSLHSVNLENNPRLDCTELATLAGQLPRDGALIYPEHCVSE